MQWRSLINNDSERMKLHKSGQLHLCGYITLRHFWGTIRTVACRPDTRGGYGFLRRGVCKLGEKHMFCVLEATPLPKTLLILKTQDYGACVKWKIDDRYLLMS